MRINNKTIQTSVSAGLFRSSIDLFAFIETLLYIELGILETLED